MAINIGSKIYLDKSWKITRQVIFLLILGIVVIGGLLAFIYREIKFFQKASPPVISLPQKGKTPIEEQSKELDTLRKNSPPLTEEEIKQQPKELDELRKETKPLTQDQIQKQIEELDKLRQ